MLLVRLPLKGVRLPLVCILDHLLFYVCIQQGLTWNLTHYSHLFSEICLFKEFDKDSIFMYILISFLSKKYHT